MQKHANRNHVLGQDQARQGGVVCMLIDDVSDFTVTVQSLRRVLKHNASTMFAFAQKGMLS
eukprot:5963514-Amphidinium_carterae.1